MAEANRTEPDRPTGLRRDRGPGSGLHWWAEVLLVLGFYAVYSAIRNLFGSESVEVAAALANAERIIDLEKALNLYVELDVQNAFLGSRWFIQFWNLFYGTFHFTVTVFVLIWVYRRFPHLYARHRSTFLCTTGLALVGFALFPLMPPRLLSDCGEYGACLATIHPYDPSEPSVRRHGAAGPAVVIKIKDHWKLMLRRAVGASGTTACRIPRQPRRSVSRGSRRAALVDG